MRIKFKTIEDVQVIIFLVKIFDGNSYLKRKIMLYFKKYTFREKHVIIYLLLYNLIFFFILNKHNNLLHEYPNKLFSITF